MMKTGMIGATLCFLLLLPTSGRAEFYQWTDGRGVIHLTDNLHSVPESVRRSPGLVIRKDIDTSRSGEILLIPDENLVFEPFPQPQDRGVVAPPEPEKAAPPLNIFYSPQQIIVVTNNIVRRPKACIPECPRVAPRFNFEDRRYIHPSVFDGGPRQYVQPESARPASR
jgi:hypothetical protein